MQQDFLRAHGSLIRFPGQDSVRHFLLSNWKLVGMGEGLHFYPARILLFLLSLGHFCMYLNT